MESLTITKWRRHFHANEVIVDVRVSCVWLIIVYFNHYELKVVFIMSMTLKTTKNMCCGLSVVFKITTRRSTIEDRKKSDLSRKNRTTGSPGHVRKIYRTGLNLIMGCQIHHRSFNCQILYRTVQHGRSNDDLIGHACDLKYGHSETCSSFEYVNTVTG